MSTVIPVNDGSWSGEIPGYGCVEIEKHGNGGGGPLLGIRLKIGGCARILPNFAMPVVGKSSEQVPLLHVVFGTDDNSFLSLVGLLQVIFVDPTGQTLVQHSLSRKLDDDWGFFRTIPVPARIGFALVLETSVSGFAPTGFCVWKIRLTLHDHLIEYGSRYLHFGSDEFSDHGDRDWYVCIEEGKLVNQPVGEDHWRFPLR